MKFDEVILGLLARRPQSGYEIGKWLRVEGRFIRANADQSQIYRTLTKLSDAGMVSFTVEQSDAGPDAKVYRLTDAGRQRVLDWIASPYDPPKRFQEPEFLARLTLGGTLRPDSVVGLIEAEIAAREAQIRQYRHRDRTLVVEPGGMDFDVELAQQLLDDVHTFYAASMDDWLAWLRQLRRSLQDRLAATV